MLNVHNTHKTRWNELFLITFSTKIAIKHKKELVQKNKFLQIEFSNNKYYYLIDLSSKV